MSQYSNSDERGDVVLEGSNELDERPHAGPEPVQYPVLWEDESGARYPMQPPQTEFEKRYPPDRFGEEAADSARVWNVYRDRVTDIDDRRIDAWNDTLGILLVFAGLFSAICTAFIIEVYKSLRPDWQEATALAVYAILTHLNGSVPTGVIVPDPTDYTASRSVYWTNGLWFGSLSLSLVASLLAILARQWLGEYRSRVRTHAESVRHWAGRHMIYSNGLDKWHLDAVLATLPVLLHAALFMFLVGLILWLWKLDLGICIAVTTLTLTMVILYALTTLLPLWFENCPTATPLLTQGRRMLRALHKRIARSRIWVWLIHDIFRRLDYQNVPQDLELIRVGSEFEPLPARQRRRSPDTDRETVQILVHMIRTFPAPQDVEVAMQAIAGLHPMSLDLLHPVAPMLVGPVTNRIRGIGTAVSDTGMRRLSALLRTMYALRVNFRDRSLEDLRDVADAAADRKTFDAFAIRVALDLLHVTEWPNRNLQLLQEGLIGWFSRGAVSGSHQGHPILPETACRLLLSLQHQQALQQSGWGSLFNISSIPLGMLAALSLCVDSEHSTNSLGEPLQTLLPQVVAVRTVDPWVPVATSSWRIRAADTWSHVLTLTYMTRSEEEERTVWQAYFGTLTGFRTRQPRSLSTAYLDRLLYSWATQRALIYGPSTSVVDGIIELCHSLLDEDHAAWSQVVAGTYFNIFYLYRQHRRLSVEDVRRAATRLLAHITPMRPGAWRRAPPTTSFWAPQGNVDGDNTWIYNSILNLLHDCYPPDGTAISFWKLLLDLPELVPKYEPGLGSDFRYRVAMALLIKLVHLSRNGVNISTYADALLQDPWCEDVLIRPDTRGGGTSEAGAVQFAQHAREVLPEWWTAAASRLVDDCDPDDDTTRSRRVEFVETVKRAGRCTLCPERITPRIDPHQLAVHDEDNGARSPTPPPTTTLALGIGA